MTTKVHHAEISFRWRVAPPIPPTAPVEEPLADEGAAGDSVASCLHLARTLPPVEARHA